MPRFRLALVALLAGACSAFAAVDPGLLSLVPAGTRMLSGIQVDHVRTSAFGQYMVAHMQNDNHDFERLVQSTGFDPRHDVQELLVASGGDLHDPQFAVFARGVFDPARIKAAALTHGATVENFDGVDVIEGKSEGKAGKDVTGHDESGVAFLDRTLAVVANRETLRAIIANRNQTAAIDPQLVQMMQEISSANDAWFASLVPGTQLPANFGPQGGQAAVRGQAIQSILQSSGGIHFGDNIDVSFDALTRSDKDAQSLVDVVRFVASMIQMQRQNPSVGLLAPALDGMTLTTDGSNMHMALSLPEKAMEQLIDMAPHPMKRAANHASVR